MAEQQQPPSYQQALAAAAAAGAVDVVGRTVQATSLSVASVREAAFANATRQLKAAWKTVDPYDGAAVQAFTETAVQVMQAAQTATSRTAAAAQQQQMRSMGIRVTVAPSNPIDVRGPRVRISDGTAQVVRAPATVDLGGARRRVTVNDMSTQDVFNRPARTYRYAKSTGATAEDAQGLAVDKIDDLVDENLMLAQRLAEAEALAAAQDLDKRVIGYRRVLHPEMSRGGSCGLCIAASDRLYKVRDLKPIHARCHCTVAAVTKEFDPGSTLNSRDLSGLYKDAQGNTAATLKRTRYQVDEHGELAAVLVPASPHKLRTAPRRQRVAA